MRREAFLNPSSFFLFSLLVRSSCCFFPDIGVGKRTSACLARSTPLWSKPPTTVSDVQNTNEKSSFDPSIVPVCSYCSQTFGSRNALFRHLRDDNDCSVKHGRLTGDTNTKIIKESVAFLFGYEDFSDSSNDIMDTRNRKSDPQPTVAEQVSQRIQQALVEALKSHLSQDETLSFLSSEIGIVSSTQSSLARLRHRALSQEAGCSATGDVVVVTLSVPSCISLSLWKRVFKTMKERLSENRDLAVQLLACRLMEKDIVPFHAERSCTQRIYHYVLPISWLPDAEVLTEWWHQPDELPQDGSTANNLYSNYPKKASKPPTDCLKFLKEALRHAESSVSRDPDNDGLSDDSIKVAKGRYGALGNRERRAWHSFASPLLVGGAVSPNHETAWRVVDRARIIGFVEEESNEKSDPKIQETKENQISAIIEFKGDDFLPQQVRRIIGSVVAMTHGWLPMDYFSVSTCRKTVIETPLAPAGRLYLSGVRFHFDELKADGLQLFQSHSSRRVVEEWSAKDAWNRNIILQQQILQRKGSRDEILIESAWYEELRDVVCPRIRKSLDLQKDVIDEDIPMPIPSRDIDISYIPVLAELRRIVADGEWPETSVARSSVIQSKNNVPEDKRKSGSFTVVNPLLFSDDGSFPAANKRFPCLVHEVFRLESLLSENKVDRFTLDGVEEMIDSNRQPSSHCAVNCNAEFTPHVDSGIGAGQTISMIVGLGDYQGGELFIEGEKIDIRYNPVEFDGFRLRHWTAKFAGERFSLVWFTPETKA
ncbi:hypothetical protein IV203_034949 [Nitzschia inconspicua]|uniref:C2H2-type domain-containing protein n=1 Tax=Nitzschia inconspicua TaxID=303405 RepID=A0A9K3LFA2_9STRA|nr:hypothetical protein IV203_034949 [Nitzschia inconspicua]